MFIYSNNNRKVSVIDSEQKVENIKNLDVTTQLAEHNKKNIY